MAGPERNPWRRLLALPNESRTKTVVIAFLVSAICAVLVSAATVYLRPIQAANRAAEEQARIAASCGAFPACRELLEQSGGTLGTSCHRPRAGTRDAEITTDTLELALSDPANWSALDPSDDLAGARPAAGLRAGLRSARRGRGVRRAPADRRIRAITAGSTRCWPGRRHEHDRGPVGDAALGDPRPRRADRGGGVAVGLSGHRDCATRRATCASPWRGDGVERHEVDGITGATRTSNAMTRMVRFWLGPEGYGPFLDAVRRGEF
jgi:Na+-transporting NADH:ubiquinone oxidoreductase subunit C